MYWTPIRESLPPVDKVLILTVADRETKKRELLYPATYTGCLYTEGYGFYAYRGAQLLRIDPDLEVYAWTLMPNVYEGEE